MVAKTVQGNPVESPMAVCSSGAIEKMTAQKVGILPLGQLAS
jgi:hypothetical protein